jgi:mannosyltransferase
MKTAAPEESANSQITWILLTSLCIGAFLRIYNFWGPNLWLDEYGTWWVVSGSTLAEVAERAIKTQGQSPVYYVIVKLFTGMFGEGSFQLRLPSVIFGILTLFVAHRLAMRIFHGQNMALAASAAVFSVNEQLIWFSQDARPYALALFLTLLSFLFFLQFLQSRRMRNGAVYTVTTALLIYSHFLFAFVLIIQIVVVTLRFGWRELLSKYWLLTFLLMAILCLPLTGQIVSLYGRRQTLNWVPNIVQSIQASLLARGFADPWALVLATVTLLAVGIKAIDLRDSPTREVLLFLVAWLIIPLAGIWAVATIIGVSFFEARYVLFVYPAALYLWAWLLVHVKPANWLRWLPSCVFLVATFSISLIPYLGETGAFRRAEKLGWDQAARTLVAAGQPSDLVVFYSAFIEADLFAQSPQETFLLSYVGWPLIAHLPPNHGFTLVGLPLRQDERTDPYIKSLEIQAAKHDRVWVIGPDEQRDYFNDGMIRQFGFHPVHSYLSDNIIKASLLVRSRSGS